MRIKITLSACRLGVIDFNYQHQIQAIIYGFLARSGPDYSTWLHKQGYVYDRDKNFKFFVFSGITFHGPIKITSPLSPPLIKRGTGGVNGFAFQGSPSNPFTLSFQIASPVRRFIQHLIEGIFKEGQEIKLGRQILSVCRVETLENTLNLNSTKINEKPINKDIQDGHDFHFLSNPVHPVHPCEYTITLKPLESPIFVKKPMPAGERDIYLFPGDKDYEELLNRNLMHKYETLYGKPYKGEPLKFDFTSPLVGKGQGEGTKTKLVKSFKVFKNGRIKDEIKGTLQPFTVSGSVDLIKIGLECGFGQNNSMGCGYVDVVEKK